MDGLVTARDRCVAQVAGRTADTDITLFKSVGAAVEDLCAAIAQWSSQVEEPQAQESAVEEETDPRLRRMFEDRVGAAIEAIETALKDDRMRAEGKKEIAGLLHQIAGVAAYFGQEELGETCRSHERDIRAAEDEGLVRELVEAIRARLAQAVDPQQVVP